MRDTSDLPAFTRSVEGLGDVLVSVAASRTRPDSLKRGLQRLVGISRRLVDLNNRTPAAFESAAVPQKFREMAESNLREVQFRAWLAPETVFAGFQVPIEQFARVYRSAVSAGDDDAALEAASALEDVIEYIAAEPGNDTLAKMTLAVTTGLTRDAVEAKARVTPVVAWTWFDSVVIMHPSMNYRPFDIGYLGEFTAALWRNVRWIIAHGGIDLFGSCVDSLVTVGGHDFDGATRHEAPDFFHYALSVPLNDDRFRAWSARGFALEKRRQSLKSLPALREWESDVDQLVGSSEGLLDSQGLETLLADAGEWKRHGESVLKMRKVAAVLFSSGSYVMFRKLPDYLPILVDYAQPPDSDASWAGWNPFPKDLDVVLKRYVLPLSERDGFNFWEGRHGHTSYDEEFAVLLLARALAETAVPVSVAVENQDASAEPANREDQPREYSFALKDLELTQVKNAGWLVDRLEKAVERLRKKAEFLSAVGIPGDSARALLEVELPSFLTALRRASDVEERIRTLAMPLSKRRLSEFADSVLTAYGETAPFRGLLIATGHYKDKTEEQREPRGLFGINTLMPRNAFIDLPYEHWSMADQQMGRDFAGAVERGLARAFAEACERFDRGVDEALEERDAASQLILTSRMWDPDSILDLRRFVPTTGQDGLLPGQQGWYRKQDESLVPVVEWYGLAPYGTVVTDTESLGELVDYDPVPDDCPEALLRKPIAVCIKEVAGDAALAEKLLSEQPDWLRDAPEGVDSPDALRGRVWLRILESYVYVPRKHAGLLLAVDAGPDTEPERALEEE